MNEANRISLMSLDGYSQRDSMPFLFESDPIEIHKSDTSVLIAPHKKSNDVMSVRDEFEGTMDQMDQIMQQYQQSLKPTRTSDNRSEKSKDQNMSIDQNHGSKGNSKDASIRKSEEISKLFDLVDPSSSDSLTTISPKDYHKIWKQSMEYGIMWYEYLFYELMHKKYTAHFSPEMLTFVNVENHSNYAIKFPASKNFTEMVNRFTPFPNSLLEELRMKQQELNNYTKSCHSVLENIQSSLTFAKTPQPSVEWAEKNSYPFRNNKMDTSKYPLLSDQMRHKLQKIPIQKNHQFQKHIQVLCMYMKELEIQRVQFYKSIQNCFKKWVESGCNYLKLLMTCGNALLKTMEQRIYQKATFWKQKEDQICKEFEKDEQELKIKSQQLVQKFNQLVSLYPLKDNDALKMLFQRYKEKMTQSKHFDVGVLIEFKGFIQELRNQSPKNETLMKQIQEQIYLLKQEFDQKSKQSFASEEQKRQQLIELKNIQNKVKSMNNYICQNNSSCNDIHQQILIHLSHLENQVQSYTHYWENTMGKREQMLTIVRNEVGTNVKQFLLQIYSEFETMKKKLESNYLEQEQKCNLNWDQSVSIIQKKFGLCFQSIQKYIQELNEFDKTEFYIEKIVQFLTVQKLMDKMSDEMNAISLFYFTYKHMAAMWQKIHELEY